MKKKKLTLEKKTILKLSADEQKNIFGGEAALTTSYFSCSGFTCCGETSMQCITRKNGTCSSDITPRTPGCRNL